MLWQARPGFILSRAALGGGTATASTARQSMVMGHFGPVFVNTSTQGKEAQADTVFVNET